MKYYQTELSERQLSNFGEKWEPKLPRSYQQYLTSYKKMSKKYWLDSMFDNFR